MSLLLLLWGTGAVPGKREAVYKGDTRNKTQRERDTWRVIKERKWDKNKKEGLMGK